MIPLTHDNYYSFQNIAISNSKVGDFLKSKNYFYRKHVLKEISKEWTPPMKIGMLVDDLVCGGETEFRKKVLKKEDPDEFAVQKHIDEKLLLTDTQWNDAVLRAQEIMKQPCYQWLLDNDAEFQVILSANLEGIPVCGMADVITQTPTTVFIDDVKSVSYQKVSTPTKWYYNCVDMGYFRQLAAYRGMWRLMHPEDHRQVVCRHLVVTNENGICKVHLYEIDNSLLDPQWEIFKETANAIVDTVDWEDEKLDWDKVVILKDPKAPNTMKDWYDDDDKK